MGRGLAGIAHDLLDQGYPFLMEKPMGINAPEVEAVAAKAARLDAFVAVPLAQRYTPFATRARELLAVGRFGPLSHIYVRLNRPGPARYQTWDCAWMLGPAEAGGGCLSMRAQRYGRIVNVASIAGIGTALSGNAFYAATKAEVLILTRRFALELGQYGITVNAVAPGFVRTELTQRGRGAADWPGTEQRFAQRAMMGRIGEPEDIANAVVFLAAPQSGWITAQVLTVDGGRMDYIGHG